MFHKHHQRTLKIPAIASVILDVLANKRYSDTVNMNARDEPNRTKDTVFTITCVDGARNASKDTASLGPGKMDTIEALSQYRE